jgi:hypothetical protein
MGASSSSTRRGSTCCFGGQQTVPPEFRGLSVSTLDDFLLDNPPIEVQWEEP